MKAYNEVYLDEIVETQGRLFDNVSLFEPGIDVENFIKIYMKSKTRASIDCAQAYVCTMDALGVWNYFRRTEKCKLKMGKSAGGFVWDWIGRFYAYFQWYYNIPSKNILELVPLDFIKCAYNGLHDLDLDLAVKKVGDKIERNANNMFSQSE